MVAVATASRVAFRPLDRLIPAKYPKKTNKLVAG